MLKTARKTITIARLDLMMKGSEIAQVTSDCPSGAEKITESSRNGKLYVACRKAKKRKEMFKHSQRFCRNVNTWRMSSKTVIWEASLELIQRTFVAMILLLSHNNCVRQEPWNCFDEEAKNTLKWCLGNGTLSFFGKSIKLPHKQHIEICHRFAAVMD